METGDSSYNDLVDILKRDLEGTPPPFEVLNTTNAAQATLPPQQQQQQQQQQYQQGGGGGFSTSPTAAGVHGGHVAVSPVQQQFQSLNVQSSQRRSSMSSTSTTSSTSQQAAATVRPYIKIVEQPAGKALRFRYECEGRSAGSIPGVNSTPELKTFPTIEIVGYEGDVVVVVSCVTKDPPYRPHPHNLVGKEGCKNGICQLTLKGKPLKAVFSNLGIQCVKKKDIKVALDLREKIQVDPFKTKFDHKDQPSSIDLNAVRLAFQAFLKTADGIRKLTPVVSDPIYDRKAMSGLVICRLCSCSAKVGGGDEIILLCEKVCKDDIKVKFYEVNAEGQVVWEDYADFQQTDIHKQTAIAFRTPRYHNPDITERANVFLQLLRPSDGVTSESLPFEYYPDPGMLTFARIRRKLKRKQDLEIFQQILSLDSETTATKYSQPASSTLGYDDDEDDDHDDDDDDDDNDDDDAREGGRRDPNMSLSEDASASTASKSDTLNEYRQSCLKRYGSDYEPDNMGDLRERHDEEGEADEVEDPEGFNTMEIEFEVPQIKYPATDECTQTSTPMEEILKNPQLSEPRLSLNPMEKIAEWMRSSEFERTDSLIVENGDCMSLSAVAVTSTYATTGTNTGDEDKPNRAEEKSQDEMESERDYPQEDTLSELPNVKGIKAIESCELPDVTASAQASVDIDENFDETATYTSLQIAFKHPIEMPAKIIREHPMGKPPSSTNEEEGLVVITNPPAPKIKVNTAQTPPSPPLPIPPRSPSPGPEQIGPPLPPKRNSTTSNTLVQPGSQPAQSPQQAAFEIPTVELRRHDSISSASMSSSRPPSQIIIMRTPDQSPTKRSLTPSPSPNKKQGFFSRIFSRRKSKAVSEPGATSSKASTPMLSREPSLGNFSLADPNRSSIRSAKSLQVCHGNGGGSLGLSPQNSAKGKKAKNGKPVGRSSSSVSGKRPTTQQNPDVIHIPLKGESTNSLTSPGNAIAFGQTLDRRTLSALQLADIPLSDGNMELVAIADRQSIRNLCEGSYGVILDPSVDLGEAEHYALYTSKPPTDGEGGVDASYYRQVEAGEILTADQIAHRLAEANGLE